METPRARRADPVCIIGGGILGASAALHLVELGFTNITLIDAGSRLSGTTYAGAGFVARFGADHDRRIGVAAIPLEEHSLAFYRGLHDSGADIEFAENGNLVLALTNAVLTTITRGIVDHPLASPGTRVVDPAAVEAMSSGAIDPAVVAGAVFMPEAIQVTTAKALDVILDRLADAGVALSWNTPAERFVVHDGRVTGVVTPGGTVDAQHIVLAAGAWTNPLLETAGWRLPLVPTVATRFITEDVGLAPTMPTVQSLELHLWLRELAGGFSWGGSFGYRRASAITDEEGIEIGLGRPAVSSLVAQQRAAEERVARVFPALAGATTERIDQGMPVYTADGGLYVGGVPGAAGLIVLAGDNESGVTHGPGMGRLAAELVAGIEPYADPTAFRLDRFAPDAFPTEADVVRHMSGDRVSAALA
jgi:glycine/D-amino acid oxidase-like deaminating enzyme